MATDRDYQRISDEAYEVDHNKNDIPWEKGDILSDSKLSTDYQVLKVEDNTSNGMQAMAVAPVNKDGKVDMSKVVITYAGTNSDDNKDIQTKILIKKHLLKNTKFFFARYCHYNMLGVEST